MLSHCIQSHRYKRWPYACVGYDRAMWISKKGVFVDCGHDKLCLNKYKILHKSKYEIFR